MKGWLREPLVHFVVLGGLLFGLYAWLQHGASGRGDNAASPVRISANAIAQLAEVWTRQQGREPTSEEMRALAAGYLREELLGHEARALGLDQNDLVIRRRLAQKVEFIVQDTSRLPAPTANDLRRLYEASLASYQSRAHVSFTQVYFNPERRRDATADARAALVALSRDGPVPRNIGDPFPLDAEVRDSDMQTVGGQFGDPFAAAVFALQPGAWHGPIASSFGLHLVRVTYAKPGRQLEFAEVESQLRERWRDEQLRDANEQYYAGLLKKYDVVVDDSVKPLIGPLGNLAMKVVPAQAQELQ